MAFIHSPKVVTNGLVLYADPSNKKSYPGSGLNLTDVSNNNNNATLTAGVVYNGNAGGSLSFTTQIVNLTTRGDYISVPNSTSLSFTNITGMAAAAWINTTANNNGSTSGSIVSKTSNVYADGYRLHRDGSKIRFSAVAATFGAGFFEPLSNKSINDGIWHYVVGTCNSSVWSIYIDGVLDNRGNYAFAWDTGANQLYIAAHDVIAEGSWAGLLGPVQLYNRELTEKEVLQNYNAVRSRFGV